MHNRFIRANEIAWQELNGQTLLVHTRSGATWTLNAAASVFWRLCDGTRTLPMLARDVAEFTGRSVAECRHELRTFSKLLLQQRILTAPEAGAAPCPAHVLQHSADSILRASYHGKGLNGPRHRPSARGVSAPA